MSNVWGAIVQIFLSPIAFPKLQGRGRVGKLIPCTLYIEADPACIKPSVGINLCIFMRERHGFGASTPWLIRASSLYLVRAEPPCSKRLAGVAVRIFMGERRGFGALMPLSTRASPTLLSGASECSTE